MHDDMIGSPMALDSGVRSGNGDGRIQLYASRMSLRRIQGKLVDQGTISRPM
jgi:hypothetical protein